MNPKWPYYMATFFKEKHKFIISYWWPNTKNKYKFIVLKNKYTKKKKSQSHLTNHKTSPNLVFILLIFFDYYCYIRIKCKKKLLNKLFNDQEKNVPIDKLEDDDGVKKEKKKKRRN